MPETAKAAAAFAEYCAMDERSLRKLAESNQKYSKSIALLMKWSTEHKWQERVKEFDAKQAEEKRRKRDADIDKMNERHAQIGIMQQGKALKQIEELMKAQRFGSQATVQLLKLATDLERIARGAPTERSEHTGPDGGPIEVKSADEEIMRKIEAIRVSKAAFQDVMGGDA